MDETFIDGQRGIVSYERVLEHKNDDHDTIEIPLATIGKALVECAHFFWEQEILDRPAPSISEHDRNFIRKCYSEGLTWPAYAKRYFGDGDLEWCGAFQGLVHLSVGDCIFNEKSTSVYVKDVVREKRMASCYRWWNYANKYGLYIKKENMRPGDIVVVGQNPKGHAWGRHITMCTKNNKDGTYETVEGNGVGTVPSGRNEEGVVKNTRSMDNVTFVVGLKPEAFHTPDYINIVDDRRAA